MLNDEKCYKEKKIRIGKDGKYQGWQWGFIISHRSEVRECLMKKEIFEQRLGGSEGKSHVNIYGNIIPGREIMC